MIKLTVSVADLTREFVELNQYVKGHTATEEQTARWHELRKVLLAAQQQPIPEAPRPPPAGS